MSIEAVLAILLSMIYIVGCGYLFHLYFFRKDRDTWKLMFWSFIIFILSFLSGVALAVEEYGYREYINTTTNETWRTPLYRENPYAYLFLGPIMFSSMLLLFFALLWMLGWTKKVAFKLLRAPRY